MTNSNKTQTHFLNSESTSARAVSPSHEGDYGVKDKRVDVVAPTAVIALIVYAQYVLKRNGGGVVHGLRCCRIPHSSAQHTDLLQLRDIDASAARF